MNVLRDSLRSACKGPVLGMASTSSHERAVILALVSVFALCVTFVIRKEINERDTYEYQDTARAKREIDQSYELLIANSEQDTLGNAVKDVRELNGTLVNK